MKKLFTIVLSLVLTFSLAACGCQAKDKTQPSTVPSTAPTTTAPTTAATTVPTTASTMPMDPTVGTNIPDPTVDANSTEGTNSITDSTEESISGTDNANDGNGDTGSRMMIR